MDTEEGQRPRGFVPIGVFFLFGATMAAYAAITLLEPGTVLDRLWALNKTGHAQLASLGKVRGLVSWCSQRYCVPRPSAGSGAATGDGFSEPRSSRSTRRAISSTA